MHWLIRALINEARQLYLGLQETVSSGDDDDVCQEPDVARCFDEHLEEDLAYEDRRHRVERVERGRLALVVVEVAAVDPQVERLVW